MTDYSDNTTKTRTTTNKWWCEFLCMRALNPRCGSYSLALKMIKSCYFMNSSATSWDPLETVRVTVNFLWWRRPTPASRHSGQWPERGGHRFKPITHVLNAGLSLTKPKTLAKWNFTTWPCPECLPVGIVFERQTCANSTFCLINHWFIGTQLFWHSTVSLISNYS